ncbi:MAG: hypothetical protein DRJ30_03165 [Candidatus Methanomethylicota archaeon]|nr:MAG: hypothetical protein DRJ30_03165 [Candidatus Verstraetearchaeota archaeon]
MKVEENRKIIHIILIIIIIGFAAYILSEHFNTKIKGEMVEELDLSRILPENREEAVQICLKSNNIIVRRIAEYFNEQIQTGRIIENGFLTFKKPIPLYKNGGWLTIKIKVLEADLEVYTLTWIFDENYTVPLGLSKYNVGGVLFEGLIDKVNLSYCYSSVNLTSGYKWQGIACLCLPPKYQPKNFPSKNKFFTITFPIICHELEKVKVSFIHFSDLKVEVISIGYVK